MKIPEIKIQLVHIDGPFKGEIHEYFSPVVTLGRHPGCDVVFPEDMRTISRRHAEIKREGNRFLLKDTSSNGTFVNGKQNAEVFLKNGDVLILGLGGPKVSFLSTILESGPDPAYQDVQAQPKQPTPPPPEPVVALVRPDIARPTEPEERKLAADIPARPAEFIQNVQKPLVIQHGVVLKAFKSLPIIIGQGRDCDFILEGPAILEHHVQIFFDQGHYWVKDLTGRNLVSINGQAVQIKAQLVPDAYLSLAPQEARFQFLGDGRLVEVQATSPAQARPVPARPQERKPAVEASEGKKFLLLIGGLCILCLGAGLIIYMVSRDHNGLGEFFSSLSVEKGAQYIKGLFGKE
jgi:pSer/pThr/pTyr-binding forkhead associated (FHA) protein